MAKQQEWITLSITLMAFLSIQYRSAILSLLFNKSKNKVKRMNSSMEDHTENCVGAAYLKKHPQGFGDLKLLENIQILKAYLLPVPHLDDFLEPSSNLKVLNERRVDVEDGTARKSTYNKMMGSENVIIGDIRRAPGMETESRAYLRAGPRKELYFEPTNVKAAIVTCGGLCPGLNNVLRDLTLSLWNLYGVREIYGIRGGFSGFYDWHREDGACKPLMLTPSTVSGIHHWGGSILKSNRGGFNVDKIIGNLMEHGISQVYVIGGDGTHRGARTLAKEAVDRGLRLTVAGIPKTIDNDVDLLDRSFGFNTSVEEALHAIKSAKTEATCVPNGIGIVKLMGRSAGFIAAHATLSSGDVNLCLVPEVPIELDGKHSCLQHLENILKERGNAVVVVAEGAGEEILGSSAKVDAGGNKILQPIGQFLKQKILDHFASNGQVVTVKYIDPSYMIRSVPANAADSLYCMMLAQNAVHGAMAGYTAFTVGLNNNRLVYLPIDAVTRNSPRCMDPFGRTWERVLCLTRQPNSGRSNSIHGAVNSNPPL